MSGSRTNSLPSKTAHGIKKSGPVETPAPAATASEKTTSRVILHVDVDAFECQVYQRLRPDLNGAPIVVANSTGRIVSANYEAKNFGITRDHRVHDRFFKKVQRRYPKLTVITVPEHPRWGKRDNVSARYASWEILDDGVLAYTERQNAPVIVNFASCDEFYFDVTALVNKRMEANPLPRSRDLRVKTILEGAEKFSIGVKGDKPLGPRIDKLYKEDPEKYSEETRLVFGAIIAKEIVDNIWTESKFRVSAGVGHNKLLAKLGTGLNKPSGITIFPIDGLQRMATKIKIEDVPGCGHVFGQRLKDSLEIKSLIDLQNASVSQIESCILGANSQELAQQIHARSYGIDLEPVHEKIRKDAINCSKGFTNQLTSFDDCIERLLFLLEELMERIEEEKYRFPRVPATLKVQVEIFKNKKERNSSSTFDWQNLKELELLRTVVHGFSDAASKLEVTRESPEPVIKTITRITVSAKYNKNEP